MIKILAIASSRKEAEILTLALKQKGYQVIQTPPSRAVYLKCLQYKPDLLLLELTRDFNHELTAVEIVKKNRRTLHLPVIGYGFDHEQKVQERITSRGVTRYHGRPLKIGNLFEDMNHFLKGKSGEAEAPSKPPADTLDKEHERILLSPDKTGGEKLDIMVERVGRLLAFPFTVARIVKTTDDDTSGAKELARIISSDSALAATILKVSNSVLFASRGRRIKDIKEAIVRVGFNETKNIALGISVMNLMDKEARIAGFDRVDYWYHSLGTAIIAERLAKRSGYQNPTEAFVAALLHDFGILILDEFFHEILEKVMSITTERMIPVIEAEREILGITHLDLCERLFEIWNMPREISYAVGGQEDFWKPNPGVEPQVDLLRMLVGSSRVLARSASIGNSCDQFVHPIPDDVFGRMKMPQGIPADFFEEVIRAIDVYRQFFGLEARSFQNGGFPDEGEGPSSLGLLDLSRSLFAPHLCYLSNRGFNLIRFRKMEELTSADNPVKAVLVDLGSQVDEVSVRKILGLPETVSAEAKATAVEKPENGASTSAAAHVQSGLIATGLPIVVFLGADSPMGNLQQINDLIVVPKDLELRQLDLIIQDGAQRQAPESMEAGDTAKPAGRPSSP